MEQIIRTHIKVIGLTCSLFFLLLAIGCSDFSNPVASATDNASLRETPFGKYESLEGLYKNPYPEITTRMLADGPAPGYRFLSIRASALDCDEDTLIANKFCDYDKNKDVKIDDLVKLRIPAYRLAADSWVSIVAPLGTTAAVADFYPHPYQFNGTVTMEWCIHELDLPDDVDWNDLVPLYVADDGTVTEMPHQWSGNHDHLTITTDHFSRYIVAQRVNG